MTRHGTPPVSLRAWVAWVGVLALVALLGVASATSGDANERFQLIVHPDNPAAGLDREFVENAYLKKTREWSTGTTIRPIDLTTSFSARDTFTREVIRKTPAQLRSYWNQRIFSGKGVPPPEVGSTAEVIEYVLTEPGAIGYLPAGIDPGDAKVLEVR